MSRYDKMISYLPLYYHTSDIFKGLMQSEGKEFDLFRENISSLLDQFFIETATWGLQYWEKELGLTVNNTKLTLDDRRSIIKSKLRGIGKAGADLIKATSLAYLNGEVDVIFEDGIKITFIDVRGVPKTLEEMKKQLGEVLPAHLPVTYVFTYLLWKEFDLLTAAVQESMTWGDLEVYRA